MTKQVWKFPLDPDDDLPVIDMPAGAQLLTVRLQGIVPCLWALVNPEAPTVQRRLAIHGTGDDVKPVDPAFLGRSSPIYVDTYTSASGLLVWHVFDHGELPEPGA